MIHWFITQPHYIQALFAGIFTWSITALGAAFVFLFRHTNKTAMDAMLGFAAGVMIAASFWSLLSPSIEMAQTLHLIPWLTAFSGFFGGGLLLFAGDQLLKESTVVSMNQKKCLCACHTETPHFFPKRSIMLMLSITLHNIPEGLAVGVAFGSIHYGLEGATLASACLLALGIGLQNFPEGTAVSVPLYRDGFSKKKAFLYGQLSALVEPVSALFGALLVLKARYVLPFILAFAAGAMIYVVVEELVPESQTNAKKDFMALFTLIGFSVMMILDVALG